MKVSLIGSNSKLANAINQLTNPDKYIFNGISRTSNKGLNIENICGSIFEYKNINNLLTNTNKAIFLIGSVGAPYGISDLCEILKTNVFSLAFLILSMESMGYTGDLIFTSTAHVYQLSEIKSDWYKEEELIIGNSLYSWILRTADFLMKEARRLLNNPQNEAKVLQNINNYIYQKPLPLSAITNIKNNYYYIYEISKIIAEEVLKTYRNKVILRLSYCYGYTDKNNIIYKYINDYFNQKTVTLSQEARNFLFYTDFVDIISYFLDNNLKDQKEENKIINITTDQSTTAEHIVNKFRQLEMVDKHSFKYNKSDMKRAEIQYSSSRLKNILKNIRNRNITTFDEGFDQVLFRYIAENRLNLKILREYVGGSYARVYLTENIERERAILKIANGNGAENGNIKLKYEKRQIESTKSILKGSKWEESVPGVRRSLFSDTVSYMLIDFIDGKTMTDYIFKDKAGLHSINNMLVKVYHILINTYLNDTIESPEDFYFNNYSGRIMRRLNNVSEYFNHSKLDCFKYLDKYEEIIINGNTCRNPISIIKDLEASGKNSLFGTKMLGLCVSGDPILDNIIDYKGNICFIDPRGDVVWKNNRPYFDPLYDIGKVFFYFAGWKLIRFEEFQLSYSHKNFVEKVRFNIKLTGEFSSLFEQVQRSLIPIYYKEEKNSNNLYFEENYLIRIYFIIASHFLSDTYPRLVGKGNHKVDQTIAEYLIGTIILNKLYEYILSQKEIDIEKMNSIGMWQDE